MTGCRQKEEKALVFASWGSKTEVQIIDTLLKEFERENPDIKVKFLHIPQNYFQKLHLMFASNLAPDVVFINNLNIPVYEKYLTDLNTLFEEEKKYYYPQVLDTMTYENRLLAIPRDVSELVIFYNKDLFDKYGVEYPKSDWTLEDLLNKAQSLTIDNHYGISFEEKPMFYLPYLRAFGGGILDKSGNLIIESDNSKKGINFYSDLRKKYNVAPKQYQSASKTMAQMFIDGQLAMHLSGRWLVPKYREEIKFDWDVINFPDSLSDSNGRRKSFVTIDSSGYAIVKSSNKQKDAVKLVKFLTSNHSSQYFAKTGLVVPAVIDTLNSQYFLDGKKPLNSKIFADIIQSAEKTPVNKNYSEITDKINEKLNYKFN
ncbi:sugar ABC transporter substrate-binding protein [bacterium]|nr:sugar ABC transporter substrate-binding protein [bacterium]